MIEVATRQMQCDLTIKTLAALFGDTGIGFIVLKGPHLGRVIYDDQLDRDYGDLDILVRPAQFSQAKALLLEHGFTSIEGSPEREATQFAFYNHGLASPHGVAVELHRSLSGHDKYSVDIDGLFERAVPFSVGRAKVLGLGTEDLLLHLCIHMGKSYFMVEKKHVLDIHLLTTRRNVDWTAFINLAKKARCCVAAYYALRAAVEQHSSAIPAKVLAELAPSRLRRAWLGLFIRPGEFPMTWTYRNSTIADQAFVGMPLIDDARRWPRIAIGYAVLRMKDVILRGASVV